MSTSLAASLWVRVAEDVSKAIGRLVGYWQVLGVNENGRLRVRSFDPDEPGEREVRKLRGMPVEEGDGVITIRLPKLFEVAVGAILLDGQSDTGAGFAFGVDGEEEVAARADHEHRGAGGHFASLELGVGAVANADRAFSIGYTANSATPDRGVLRANEVFIERSSGNGQTELILRDAGNATRRLTVTANSVKIGNTVEIGGSIMGLVQANKAIASGGPWVQRVGPTATAEQIFSFGTPGVSVHDIGTRRNVGGTNYALIISNYGIGYIPSAGIV